MPAAGLIRKRDIQYLRHHLTHTTGLSVGGNGTLRKVHRTNATTRHSDRGLKRFINCACAEDYLPSNPMAGLKLKPPKDPPVEPWRLEQIERMFQVLEHEWREAKTAKQRMLSARNNAIVELFLESGLRLSELAGLKLEDIYLEKQRLLVSEGKTGRGRWVGFGPQTRKALWRHLGLRPAQVVGGALWVTEEGRPLTGHGIQAVFRRLERDAGLLQTRGSVDKCRHTWATTYIRETHDMRGCQTILGHSEETTELQKVGEAEFSSPSFYAVRKSSQR